MKWPTLYEWLNLVLQVGLIVIGVIVACIYHGQWNEMIQQTKLSQHSYEVAYGANVVPDWPQGFTLRRGQDSEFVFPSDNIGNAQASNYTYAFDNDIRGKDDPWSFHLDCFPRGRYSYFYKGQNNRKAPRTTIHANKLSKENWADLLTGKSILKVYGFVISYNLFCFRCATACFVFIPPKNSQPEDEEVHEIKPTSPARAASERSSASAGAPQRATPERRQRYLQPSFEDQSSHAQMILAIGCPAPTCPLSRPHSLSAFLTVWTMTAIVPLRPKAKRFEPPFPGVL